MAQSQLAETVFFKEMCSLFSQFRTLVSFPYMHCCAPPTTAILPSSSYGTYMICPSILTLYATQRMVKNDTKQRYMDVAVSSDTTTKYSKCYAFG